NIPTLSAAHQDVGMSAALVGSHNHSRTAQIQVLGGQSALVEWGKEIQHGQSGGKLHITVAIVWTIRLHRAVAGGKVNCRAIRSQPSATLPNAGAAPVGTGIEHRQLRKRCGVISEDPTVIISVVIQGGERDVDRTVVQQNPGSRVLDLAIEGDHTVHIAAASAFDSRLNLYRPAKFFRAGGDIESM